MAHNGEVEVSSLRTTDDILEVIRRRGGAGASEIANELEKPVSTVHNHLTSLEHLGYLVKQDANTYVLSYRFLEFGGGRRQDSAVVRAARSHLQSLAAETGEIVNLMVEEHGSAVIVDLHRGEDAVDIDSYIGCRIPIHATASGKSMLAHFSDERVDSIFDRQDFDALTDNTLASRDALRSELETVRAEGIAYDDEERLENLRCVGAPILDDDTVLGSVSVSGPSGRMQAERFREHLPQKIQNTVELITIDLKYS